MKQQDIPPNFERMALSEECNDSGDGRSGMMDNWKKALSCSENDEIEG